MNPVQQKHWDLKQQLTLTIVSWWILPEKSVKIMPIVLEPLSSPMQKCGHKL